MCLLLILNKSKHNVKLLLELLRIQVEVDEDQKSLVTYD